MSEDVRKELASLKKRVENLEKTKQGEEIVFPCDDAWWFDKEPDIEIQKSGKENEFLPVDIEFWEEKAKKEEAKKKTIEEKIKEALSSEIELEETPAEEG